MQEDANINLYTRYGTLHHEVNKLLIIVPSITPDIPIFFARIIDIIKFNTDSIIVLALSFTNKPLLFINDEFIILLRVMFKLIVINTITFLDKVN